MMREGRGHAARIAQPGAQRDEQPHVEAVVTFGGSAGAVEPLIEVMAGLPGSTRAAFLVVVHGPRDRQSVLPRILSRAGTLPTSEAVDGEPVRPGHVYVARPDHHLVLEDGRLRVRRGPEVNRSRPAIDPLFQSLAAFGAGAPIGVVLSGSLDDRAIGLAAIHRSGGTAIVQDPADAQFSGMPRAALELVPDATVAPSSELADAIVRALEQRTPVLALPSSRLGAEVAGVTIPVEPMDPEDTGAVPAVFGCPDCGGALWELGADAELRFRCRVGHAYTARTLLHAQSRNVEQGLWTAIRALEEQAVLARRLAQRAEDREESSAFRRFERQAAVPEAHAASIRSIVREDPGEPLPTEADEAAELERRRSS